MVNQLVKTSPKRHVDATSPDVGVIISSECNIKTVDLRSFLFPATVIMKNTLMLNLEEMLFSSMFLAKLITNSEVTQLFPKRHQHLVNLKSGTKQIRGGCDWGVGAVCVQE